MRTSDDPPRCFVCSLPVTTEEGTQIGIGGSGDSPLLLRTQLEAFYLVKSLLEVSSDVCEGFFYTYGNPREWIRICPSCRGSVREAFDLHLNIKELVGRIEDIRTRLLRPLMDKGSSGEGEDPLSGCERQIMQSLVGKMVVAQNNDAKEGEEEACRKPQGSKDTPICAMSVLKASHPLHCRRRMDGKVKARAVGINQKSKSYADFKCLVGVNIGLFSGKIVICNRCYARTRKFSKTYRPPKSEKPPGPPPTRTFMTLRNGSVIIKPGTGGTQNKMISSSGGDGQEVVQEKKPSQGDEDQLDPEDVIDIDYGESMGVEEEERDDDEEEGDGDWQMTEWEEEEDVLPLPSKTSKKVAKYCTRGSSGSLKKKTVKYKEDSSDDDDDGPTDLSKKKQTSDPAAIASVVTEQVTVKAEQEGGKSVPQQQQGPQLLSRLFDGIYYICPIPACDGKPYRVKQAFMDHIQVHHSTFMVHLRNDKPLTPVHKCKEDLCLLFLHPQLQGLGASRMSKPNSRDPIYPSLLSKEEIQTLTPQEIKERLIVNGLYLCPFCPHVKTAKRKRWNEHLRTKHVKFRLHLNEEGVPAHECEEGSCLPRTTGMVIPDWRQLLQMKAQGTLDPEAIGLSLKALAIKYKVVSFPCTKCSSQLKPFSTYKAWREHQTADHKSGFPCPHCAQTFFPMPALEQHVRVSHTDNAFLTCSGCQGVFLVQHKFKLHLKEADPESACVQNALSCSKCSVKLETQGSLKVHTKLRHDTVYEAPFRCEHCGKGFFANVLCKAHMETHTSEGHVCSVCGMKVRTRMRLRNHVKRMHGSARKDYSCHVCKRLFRHECGLKRHLKLHQGGAPQHLCPVCGKTFKLKDYLTLHSWSHDPEKRQKFREYSERQKQRKMKGIPPGKGRGRKVQTEEQEGLDMVEVSTEQN